MEEIALSGSVMDLTLSNKVSQYFSLQMDQVMMLVVSLIADAQQVKWNSKMYAFPKISPVMIARSNGSGKQTVEQYINAQTSP